MKNLAQLNLELDSVKHDWLEEVLPRVVTMLPALGEFSTDDLHLRIFPSPPHRNYWGILLAKLKSMGLVKRTGYQPSARKEANGRVVAVWRML